MSELTKRQQEIANRATGPDAKPATIDYTAEEDGVWSIVSRTLDNKWEERAASDVLAARDKLMLPHDRIPQLGEVTSKLQAMSGFTFRAMGGLASKEEFFGGLAAGDFLSTQYIREAANPFYTERPDIIHEVIGHGTLLADKNFAELHRLAGAALVRMETQIAKQFIANVWWFSGEFGVIATNNNLKAFGAGILSSVNELDHIQEASITPLHIASMGTVPYRIDQLQPRLFAGQSVAHVMDVVGGFFTESNDDQIVRLSLEAK